MQMYKGHYIDHVFFNSKEDIDKSLKESAIRYHKMLTELFCQKPSIDTANLLGDSADRLNSEFGIDYDEIEYIEISVMKTA